MLKLKEIREAKGVSRYQLAKKAGLHIEQFLLSKMAVM